MSPVRRRPLRQRDDAGELGQELLQGAERAQPAAEHATAPNDEAYDHERQQHAQQRVGEEHGQAVAIDEPAQPRKNVDDA